MLFIKFWKIDKSNMIDSDFFVVPVGCDVFIF